MQYGILLMPRGGEIPCETEDEAYEQFATCRPEDEIALLIVNGRQVARYMSEQTKARYPHLQWGRT